MHWTHYVLLGTALLVAHFDGSFTGTLALKHGWSDDKVECRDGYSHWNSVPHSNDTLLLKFRPPRGAPLLRFAILPILMYARLRMKKAPHLELKFFQQPPRKR